MLWNTPVFERVTMFAEKAFDSLVVSLHFFHPGSEHPHRNSFNCNWSVRVLWEDKADVKYMTLYLPTHKHSNESPSNCIGKALRVEYVYVLTGYVLRKLDKRVKYNRLQLCCMYTLIKLHTGSVYVQSVSVVRSQGGYVFANLAQITRLQPPVVWGNSGEEAVRSHRRFNHLNLKSFKRIWL